MKPSARAVRFALLLIGLLAVGIWPAPAARATSVVPCGDVSALIAAITSANAVDTPQTVVLAPECTYTITEAIDTPDGPVGLPSISGHMTLEGQGASIVGTHDTGILFRLFHITEGGSLTLRNLTLSGGAATNEVSCPGLVRPTDGVVIDHTASGGALFNRGTLVLSDTMVSANKAIGGGGIYNAGDLHVFHSQLNSNMNSVVGGGAILNDGTMTLTDSVVSDNVTCSDGGGIFNSGSALLRNSEVRGNYGEHGGGIGNAGTLTLVGSRVLTNTSLVDGGGLYNIATSTLQDSELNGNTVEGDGGGIFSSGTLTATNTTLSDNRATGSGGGISMVLTENSSAPPSLRLIASTVTSNTADMNLNGLGDGGGLAASAGTSVFIAASLIAGNFDAPGTNDLGNTYPDISRDNATTLEVQAVTKNTFEGTQVYEICISGPSYPTPNCNGFFREVANRFTWTNLKPGEYTVTQTDLGPDWQTSGVPTTVTLGAGAHQTVVVTNTLINGEPIPDPPADPYRVLLPLVVTSATPDALIRSGGYNLIGDGSGSTGMITATGDLVGNAASPIAPLLGPLSDNGGPTHTHALLPGSPALDAIPLTACTAFGITTDARGVTRPQGSQCDIGAFEQNAR